MSLWALLTGLLQVPGAESHRRRRSWWGKADVSGCCFSSDLVVETLGAAGTPRRCCGKGAQNTAEHRAQGLCKSSSREPDRAWTLTLLSTAL